MAAANEYYSQNRLQDPRNQRYSAYSSYSGQPPSPYSAPSPVYSSQHHLASGDRPAQGVSPSPFESVFDDHVYPAPSASQHQLSQHDTGYHRLSRPSEELAYNQTADDIPLRDHAQKYGAGKDVETPVTDHVYDASGPPPPRKKSRRGRVRFGELGMIGSGGKKIPFVVYLFTIIQVAVFIGEIVRNATTTGSPIMTQPSFNPMIGPSNYVLVNMGARYVPCMRNTPGIQTSTKNISWPCPSTTTNDPNSPMMKCTLSDLCGFGGVPEPLYNENASINQKPEPNQWFRFIIPIFLHAGLIHIGFNLLLQLTMGRDMESRIGSIRFFLVYMSSGIFGFVMGGNFAATGIASTGASGSLFGVIALTLLDLLYSWKDRRSPVKELAFIMLDILISFVLGLLPGLDNFSHIGGFVMGLALGICVLHSPNSLRRRIGDEPPYSHVDANGILTQGTPPPFFKNPVGFFKGRKPLWWAWWVFRAAMLVLVTICFILLINNFYIYRTTCSWCKYLTCLPVNNWCDIGNLKIE